MCAPEVALFLHHAAPLPRCRGMPPFTQIYQIALLSCTIQNPSLGLLYRFSCGRYVGILGQHAKMYRNAGLPNRAAWYRELTLQGELLPTSTSFASEQGNQQVAGQTVNGFVHNATGDEMGAAQTDHVQDAPDNEQGALTPVNTSLEDVLGGSEQFATPHC